MGSVKVTDLAGKVIAALRCAKGFISYEPEAPVGTHRTIDPKLLIIALEAQHPSLGRLMVSTDSRLTVMEALEATINTILENDHTWEMRLNFRRPITSIVIRGENDG